MTEAKERLRIGTAGWGIPRAMTVLRRRSVRSLG